MALLAMHILIREMIAEATTLQHEADADPANNDKLLLRARGNWPEQNSILRDTLDDKEEA